MRMTACITLIATLALAACNQQPDKGEGAADFAQRVNGNGPAAAANPTTGPSGQPAAPTQGSQPAKTAFPKPVRVPPEPDQGQCDVQKVAPYFGQPDSPATRQAIMTAIAPRENVRFVKPGPQSVTPDPKSDRLNVMIDVTGVVRTARCG